MSAGKRPSGNACEVIVTPVMPQSPPGAGAFTRCYTWPSGKHRAGVTCWNQDGEPIQCCGHGLLSCAHLWTGQWGGDGELAYGDSQISCRSVAGKTWLGFDTINPVTCGVPAWLQDTLGTTVTACAEAGAADGYLVVELDNTAQLRSIIPPGDALASHTRRALIVSCRVTPNSASQGENIQFRYFAPQYGQAEDTATGSAMRVLAPYWQQRGQGGRLKAYQRSPGGGLLYSCLKGERTWVGGRLAVQDTEVATGE